MDDKPQDQAQNLSNQSADSPWIESPPSQPPQPQPLNKPLTPPQTETQVPLTPPPIFQEQKPGPWWEILKQPEEKKPQSQAPVEPMPPEPSPLTEPEPSPLEPASPVKPAAPSLEPPPPAVASGEGGPPPPFSKRFNLGLIPKLFLGFLTLVVIIVLGSQLFLFIKNKISPPPQITTLVYWGLWEDKNVLSSLIADFERQHPNIKIDYQKRDIKQYREALKARFAQKQGPDIFRFHNSWLPQFKDDLLPLPKMVTGENPKNDFYSVVTQDLTINGAYFGIPLQMETLLLFVNTEILESAGVSPPKNWNELKKLAPQLTIKEASGKIKTAGVALGTYDNISHASDIISLMLAQNGVNLKKIDQAPENTQDTLVFYTSFAKGEGSVWDESLDSSLLAFAKGNLAMFFGYSWDVFTLQALNPNLKFKILPVPQLSEEKKVNLASYWVEGVSKKSKNQKAALEFLAYLNKKETLEKFFSEVSKTRLFGEPYARIDLADSLKDNPYLSVVMTQAKEAKSTPFSSDTFDNGLNSELNNYLGDAVRSLLSNTSPETALETFLKGVDQVYTKYGIR